MRSVINTSIEQILQFFTKLMEIYKKVMAWLGIAVLPDSTDTTAEPSVTE